MDQDKIYLLRLNCKDQVGIVSKISTLLANKNCNIIESKQFTDQDTNTFFIRQSFELPNELNIETIKKKFKNLSDILNAEYERVLWKPIRRAFPYMEKKIRQRKQVSAPVNKIRNFRNRVFHHEPIAWNSEALENIHEDILKVIGWISKDLPEISKKSDRASNKMNELKVFLNQ